MSADHLSSSLAVLACTLALLRALLCLMTLLGRNADTAPPPCATGGLLLPGSLATIAYAHSVGADPALLLIAYVNLTVTVTQHFIRTGSQHQHRHWTPTGTNPLKGHGADMEGH